MKKSYPSILIAQLIRILGKCKDGIPARSEKEIRIIVRTLLKIVNLIDNYTYCHSLRVSEYCQQMAEKLNMSEKEKRILHFGALLHDVGKIGVGKKILCKIGPLNEEEWELIKEHPVLGARMLEDSEYLSQIIPMVKHHHENFDGSGYPDGLKGEEIPYHGRILTIADSFDAMITNRPYSPARSKMAALEEIRKCSATQFDPSLIPIFFEILS